MLLVCVYDTVVFELSNDMIYSTFKEHGQVQKVLIFERGEVTKCFVELISTAEAVRIKENLDGKKMFESFCKMHIYFSNLKEVDLRNQYSKGKDYSSCHSESSAGKLPYFDGGLLRHPPCDELKRAKTTNEGDLVNAMSLINSEDFFDECIKSDIIGNILDDDYSEPVEAVVPRCYGNENSPAFSNPLLYPAYRSECLCFPYEGKLAIREVYNLFSNFGNI